MILQWYFLSKYIRTWSRQYFKKRDTVKFTYNTQFLKTRTILNKNKAVEQLFGYHSNVAIIFPINHRLVFSEE